MKKDLIFVIFIMLVIVFHNEAQALLVNNLETVIVTASRIRQEESKITGNISIITNEQITESRAQSIPDILRDVEGIFVYDFSTTKTSVLDIRGFGDTASRNVLVLLDGRRLNLIDSGSADLVQVPIDVVERIEIMRGSGSVLYGDNAVGGVINIITKKGKEGMYGKISTILDSYSSRGQNVEIRGRDHKLSYYLFAKYLDKRGYRNNADEIYHDYNGRLDYKATDKTIFSLQYGYHDDAYDLPGGLNENEIMSLGRRGSSDIDNKATTKDQYVRFTMDINSLLEDVYWGNVILDFNWRDRKLFDIINSYNFVTHRYVTSKGISARYIFHKELMGHDVNLVSGVDVYHNDNDILGSGINSDDLTVSRNDLGVYFNLQLESLDDLYFVGGLRYNKVKYIFDQRSGIPNFEKQKPSETVSLAGLKYEYGKGSNVYLNFQQTFRFLTTDEWYSSFSGLNTNLKQQTGQQYEFGVKHNVHNKSMFSLTSYYIETENELFFDPSYGSFGSNSNYDKTRRFGIESVGRFDLKEFFRILKFFDKFEYFVNYTYQDPKFVGGSNDGHNIPFVPEHQVSSGIVSKFMKHYSVSLFSRYVGDRFVINDTGNNLPKAKSYCVTDINITYQKKSFEYFIKVNNVFDRRYEGYHVTNASLSIRDVYPSSERNFVFGVSFKF